MYNREEYLMEQIKKVEHDLQNLIGYHKWLKAELEKEKELRKYYE